MICEASLLSHLKNGTIIHPIYNFVCKKSVRHVLGLRDKAHLHRYDLPKLTSGKYPNIFIEEHNIKSLSWSIIQAKKIDIIGLDTWLDSDAAIFGYYDDSSDKKLVHHSDSDSTIL